MSPKVIFTLFLIWLNFSQFIQTYYHKYSMQKKSELFKLMQEPLPSITKQKRLGYRTSHLEVVNLYKLLNYTIFNNAWSMPELEVIP